MPTVPTQADKLSSETLGLSLKLLQDLQTKSKRGERAQALALDMLQLRTDESRANFESAWNRMAELVHQTNDLKGEWDERKGVEGSTQRRLEDIEIIVVLHANLSHAATVLRDGGDVGEFINELAGVLLGVMDMCHARGWEVARALGAKAANNTR